MFKTASMTGMRLAEVLNLNLKWFDWEKNLITIPAEHNKNKQESSIWICSPLLTILKNYIKTEQKYFREGYLFCIQANNKESMSRQQLGHPYWQFAWKKYLTRAGLLETKYLGSAGQKMNKIRFHTSTRTYFINKLFQANPNRNIAELSRITRHRSIQCLYDHYLRFNDLQLQQDCLNKTFKKE
jgi:integrase